MKFNFRKNENEIICFTEFGVHDGIEVIDGKELLLRTKDRVKFSYNRNEGYLATVISDFSTFERNNSGWRNISFGKSFEYPTVSIKEFFRYYMNMDLTAKDAGILYAHIEKMRSVYVKYILPCVEDSLEAFESCELKTIDNVNFINIDQKWYSGDDFKAILQNLKEEQKNAEIASEKQFADSLLTRRVSKKQVKTKELTDNITEDKNTLID